MKFLAKFAIVILFTIPVRGSESTSAFDSSFQSGIKNYEEKKFEQAASDLKKSVEVEPYNVSALTNLALAQYQLGDKAMAIALLRQALFIDPSSSVAKSALEFILPQLEIKEIPHQILLNETLHEQILAPFSLFSFSALAALFVFSAGWSLFGFFGKRRRALRENHVPPNFSFLTFVFSLGAIVFLGLFLAKVFDQMQVRGTVIAKSKLPALSSPDEKAPSTFDIYPGFEVIVQKFVDQGDQHWVQINYPGGPTGWLSRSAIFITTEK